MGLRAVAFVAILTATALRSDKPKRIVPATQVERDGFDRQPKVAVVVGVGSYTRESGWAKLDFAASDATELAEVLELQGYKVKLVTDTSASYVRKALLDARKLIGGQGGTLVFFFSGHGFENNGRIQLATSDALISLLSTTGLPLTEVEELMRATGARRRVLWIDACRVDSGTGAKGSAPVTRSEAWLSAASGTRILYASAAGEASYESQELRHGVFTAYLLRGLRGEAAGGDGLITQRDLADYVSEQVQAYSFRHGQTQVPFEAGEATRDFLIGKALAAPVNASNGPPVQSGNSTLLQDRFTSLFARARAIGGTMNRAAESLRAQNLSLNASLVAAREQLDMFLSEAESQMKASQSELCRHSLDQAEGQLMILERRFGNETRQR